MFWIKEGLSKLLHVGRTSKMFTLIRTVRREGYNPHWPGAINYLIWGNYIQNLRIPLDNDR